MDRVVDANVDYQYDRLFWEWIALNNEFDSIYFIKGMVIAMALEIIRYEVKYGAGYR